jgi:hypothetical protein
MVVADFVWRGKGVLAVEMTVWLPLAGDLFPEALGTAPRFPLSGFRVLDIELARGPLPTGFGAETQLNVVGAIDGRTTATVDIGVFVGVIRPHASMYQEVATTILDLAVARGRLDRAARPAWDAWVGETIAVVGRYRSGDGVMAERFKEELMALAARPRPPRGLSAGARAAAIG